MLLKDGVTHHPKVLQVGAEAAWLWVAAIDYCRAHLTDGVVPAAVLPTLGIFRAKLDTLVANLVAVRLFETTEGGYLVHDFLEHNDSREQVLTRRREDSERKRGNRHAGVRLESVRNPPGILAEKNTLARGRVGVGVGSYRSEEKGKSEGEGPTSFDTFWAAYPKRVGKADALKAWKAIKPSPQLVDIILAALGQQARTQQWQDEGGRFIPHPATWLRRAGWDDELEPLMRGPNYYADADEWQCPHDPHCGSRGGCERRLALDAIKAEAVSA